MPRRNVAAGRVGAEDLLPASVRRVRRRSSTCASAQRIPCTAHLELLDARRAVSAPGLHGIEHITSFGLSLLPRLEAETYRQAVLRDNDARREGRYRMFAARISMAPRQGALRRAARAATLARSDARRLRAPRRSRRRRHEPEIAPVLAAGFAKMQQLTRRAAREGARIVMGGHTEVPFAAAARRRGASWSCSSKAASRRSRRSPPPPAPRPRSSIAATSSAALRPGLQGRSRRPSRRPVRRHVGRCAPSSG